MRRPVSGRSYPLDEWGAGELPGPIRAAAQDLAIVSASGRPHTFQEENAGDKIHPGRWFVTNSRCNPFPHDELRRNLNNTN